MGNPNKQSKSNSDYAITQRLFALIAALFSWSAIIIQAYIFFRYRTASTLEIVIRFFSYFTVLSNMLVAIVYTVCLLKTTNSLVIFFQKATTLYAVTVYILIVGIVYNTVLRDLWHPTGMQRWIAEVMHAFIPLLFFIYWLLFIAPIPIIWKASFHWLVFPVIYFVIILIRGNLTGYYPYPFFDVTKNGLPKTLINGWIIFIFFWSLSICLIGVGKLIQRRKKRRI